MISKSPKGLDVSIITQEVLSVMRAGDGDPFGGSRLPDLEVVERYQHLTPVVRTAQVSNPQIATEGSNNWVMSGERSPTGVPILANDPHRRIEMPALRYFVHLNAPGWNVIGGGEPPFVGVDAGTTSGWRGASRSPGRTWSTSTSRRSTRRIRTWFDGKTAGSSCASSKRKSRSRAKRRAQSS